MMTLTTPSDPPPDRSRRAWRRQRCVRTANRDARRTCGAVRRPARGRELRLTDSRVLAPGEHSNNLPAPFASFVGREHQIEALGRLLDSHRLVTLAGAPGVGKTRLAVQLANQLRTG